MMTNKMNPLKTGIESIASTWQGSPRYYFILTK